ARVWRSMNWRSGVLARSRNCDCVSAPFEYGVSASVEMRVSVGDMTIAVRMSAMPVSTELGGSAAAPMAERTSDRTTTIRANDVHMTRTNGAADNSVSAASTSSGSV